MAKRTGPTNKYLRDLIEFLRKKYVEERAPIWKKVAELLERPRRRRVEVNISEIERNCEEGDVVLVPGVVLGNGEIKKKVKVAAWRFSTSAREKLESAGCKTMSIEDVVKEFPKGSGVKLMV